AELFGAVAGAHHRNPRVDEHAVAPRVVPVIVRVEYVTDRLAGGLADFGQDLADAPRRVGVDHYDIVAENHPARVRRLPPIPVALPDVHPRCELPDFPDSAVLLAERHEEHRSEYSHNPASSHLVPPSPVDIVTQPRETGSRIARRAGPG